MFVWLLIALCWLLTAALTIACAVFIRVEGDAASARYSLSSVIAWFTSLCAVVSTCLTLQTIRGCLDERTQQLVDERRQTGEGVV